MASYDYSVASSFNSVNPATAQLNQEINAVAGIAPNCTAINQLGDTVTIYFSASLSEGEITTLNGVIAAHVPRPIFRGSIQNYADAVVATDGSGAFTSIAAAFASGAVTVFVRRGLYVETSDIIMPENGTLVGETVSSVGIAFVGAKGIRIDGSGGVKQTAGTISITNGTTTVTGVGTSFTSLVAGSSISLGNTFYDVLSVQSDTQLTLLAPYRGQTLTNNTYIAQKIKTAVFLSNFIVRGSSTTAIYVRAVKSCVFHYVGVVANAAGVELIDAIANGFTFCNISYNSSFGLRIDNSRTVSIATANIYNTNGVGLDICNNSGDISISNTMVSQNNGIGLLIRDGSDKIMLNGSTVNYNTSDGISVSGAESHGIIIDSTVCSFNGDNGIDVSNGEWSAITDCTVESNGSHGILAGVKNVVNGNHVCDNGGDGVRVTAGLANVTNNQLHGNTLDGINILSGADDCIVNANLSSSNSGNGLVVSANTCIIGSNRCVSNDGKGCHITEGATSNIVKMNCFTSNTGVNYDDDGTNTITDL